MRKMLSIMNDKTIHTKGLRIVVDVDWARYERILFERKSMDKTVLLEAEKQFKQAEANYKESSRMWDEWNTGIEARLNGIERQTIAKESVHENPNYHSHS